MKNEIQKEVLDTLNVVNKIENVRVSPFFAHKVMQKINAEKETKKQAILSWFSPSFQLVAIALALVINAVVLFYHVNNTTKVTTSIDDFAQEYALMQNTNTLLN